MTLRESIQEAAGIEIINEYLEEGVLSNIRSAAGKVLEKAYNKVSGAERKLKNLKEKVAAEEKSKAEEAQKKASSEHTYKKIMYAINKIDGMDWKTPMGSSAFDPSRNGEYINNIISDLFRKNSVVVGRDVTFDIYNKISGFTSLSDNDRNSEYNFEIFKFVVKTPIELKGTVFYVKMAGSGGKDFWNRPEQKMSPKRNDGSTDEFINDRYGENPKDVLKASIKTGRQKMTIKEEILENVAALYEASSNGSGGSFVNFTNKGSGLVAGGSESSSTDEGDGGPARRETPSKKPAKKGKCPDCKPGKICSKCKKKKAADEKKKCPDCKPGKVCPKCKKKAKTLKEELEENFIGDAARKIKRIKQFEQPKTLRECIQEYAGVEILDEGVFDSFKSGAKFGMDPEKAARQSELSFGQGNVAKEGLSAKERAAAKLGEKVGKVGKKIKKGVEKADEVAGEVLDKATSRIKAKTKKMKEDNEDLIK